MINVIYSKSHNDKTLNIKLKTLTSKLKKKFVDFKLCINFLFDSFEFLVIYFSFI